MSSLFCHFCAMVSVLLLATGGSPFVGQAAPGAGQETGSGPAAISESARQESVKNPPVGTVERKTAGPISLSPMFELVESAIPSFSPDKPALRVATAWIEFDELLPGQVYLLDVAIRNSTSRLLELTHATTSCGCMQFRMSPQEIPAGDSGAAGARFQTPDSTADGKMQFAIDLWNGKDLQARLIVNGKLVNNLHLPDHVFFRVGDSIESFRVPVSVTPPITVASLRIEKPERLQDVQFLVQEIGEKIFVEALATPTSFRGDYASGEIQLISDTGVHARSEILISRKLPVTFSPDVLRFSARNPEESKIANLLIQIDGKLLTDLPPDQVQIGFNMDSMPVSCTARKLAPGIYRVSLEITLEQMERTGDIDSMNCVLKVGSRTLIQTVRFYVMEQ